MGRLWLYSPGSSRTTERQRSSSGQLASKPGSIYHTCHAPLCSLGPVVGHHASTPEARVGTRFIASHGEGGGSNRRGDACTLFGRHKWGSLQTIKHEG